jgi:pimeloyl-ACP methyl ester carboxylesterase
MAFASVADPALAEKMLAHEPTEEEIEERLKNALAMARVAWQPRLHNPQLAKWLHRIDLPTHLIWGEQDKILPLAYAGKFQALIAHAKLSVLPACGHLPHSEVPEQYAQALTDFIASV